MNSTLNGTLNGTLLVMLLAVAVVGAVILASSGACYRLAVWLENRAVRLAAIKLVDKKIRDMQAEDERLWMVDRKTQCPRDKVMDGAERVAKEEAESAREWWRKLWVRTEDGTEAEGE